MQIGIVCKVIDNFGDAGFCLRLAKALALQGKQITLLHDNAATFDALYPEQNVPGLEILDATRGLDESDVPRRFDLLLEPFGSSSEQTHNRFDLWLKNTHPNTPWLLIDYLSSEGWVENFHLNSSTDPRTGHVTTYFYPGFTAKTGGLIHCDYPAHLRTEAHNFEENRLKLFVFAYPNAPLPELLHACETDNGSGKKIQVGLADWKAHTSELAQGFHCLTTLPFCPQGEFDELLAQYDVLFVRGEDSFVRAQLAGKPLIWQIYATEDNAHASKLASFFDLYSKGLSQECALALWNCWRSWNSLENSPNFSECWIGLSSHWHELQTHAQRWQKRLFDGPELVKEVLTWCSGQTPTLIEKPDL